MLNRTLMISQCNVIRKIPPVLELLSLLLLLYVLSDCNGIKQLDVIDRTEKDNIDSVFRFIHISDTHGSIVSIDAVNRYCDKHTCDFAIITGDVLPNYRVLEAVTFGKCDYLIIPGNHDADDHDGLGQYAFRSSFLNKLNNSVNFPDSKVNYWYRDFEKFGKRLRVIGLDQFELDSYGSPSGIHALMTQEQIDWFVGLLMNSATVDGVIVLIHMGFGNAIKGQRDITNQNEFISELADKYNNSYDFYGPVDPFMIPEIIAAYTRGEALNKIYNKDSEYEITVNTEFNPSSNNFIGYFGGHLHWDEIEYLYFFPDQLQCLIAFCGSGIGSSWNDLIKTDYPYLFNVVEVDLWNNRLSITREGASNTISGHKRSCLTLDLIK